MSHKAPTPPPTDKRPASPPPPPPPKSYAEFRHETDIADILARFSIPYDVVAGASYNYSSFATARRIAGAMKATITNLPNGDLAIEASTRKEAVEILNAHTALLGIDSDYTLSGPDVMTAARAAVHTLTMAFTTSADAFAALSESLYSIAKVEYRREVGRLPGSERTARLRKKRRDMVMDWWLAE